MRGNQTSVRFGCMPLELEDYLQVPDEEGDNSSSSSDSEEGAHMDEDEDVDGDEN